MTEHDIGRIVERLRVEMMTLHLGDDYVVTEEEAARLLGVSASTLRRRRLDGDLTAGSIAGKPRYGLGAIRALMRHLADGGAI